MKEKNRDLNYFKLGMWFLFITTIVLPAIYVLYYESIPRDYTVPEVTIKANVWKQNFTPLPKASFDKNLANLGKKIYFDGSLTPRKQGVCESCHRIENNRPDVCFEMKTASCNSCHQAPIRGSGSDGLATFLKIDGSYGERNTLSIWNSRYNVGHGWEAREFDLTQFIASHIADSEILGMRSDEFYKAVINSYKELKTTDEVINSLVEYTKSLVATDSRFDRYLQGEKDAISPLALKGFETFKKIGCNNCHNGINIGGNSLKTFGVYKLHKLNDGLGLFALTKNSFEDENLRRSDEGAKTLTGWNMDQFLFRVGSLRNIEITRPYFTNGQVWALEDAIKTMGRVQLGRNLTPNEVSEIAAFLGSISGVIPVIERP